MENRAPSRPVWVDEREAEMRDTVDSPATSHVGDYGDAFPHSTRVFVEGRDGVRVPFREIALSGGEPPLRVYDTSGPRSHDVREGLPALRAEWIRARGGVETVSRSYRPISGIASVELPTGLSRRTLRGTGSVTQMSYARRVRSRPRWSSSRSARGCRPSSSATRSRAAGRSSRRTSITPSSSR